jgi:hypothetical protein
MNSQSQLILSPLEVRRACLHYANKPEPVTFDKGKFGAAIGALGSAVAQLDLEGNDVTQANRRLVCGFVFTPDDKPFEPLKGSQLTPQMQNGLYRWVGSALINGEWMPRDTFRDEANWILSVSVILYNTEVVNGGKLRMSRLLDGYQVECGIIGSKDCPEYWLAQAQALEDQKVNRVYQEVGSE